MRDGIAGSKITILYCASSKLPAYYYRHAGKRHKIDEVHENDKRILVTE